MEETPLSPVLLRFPLVDRATGLVTRPWQQWFIASWYRQGGANAPPNDTLGGSLGALETALEATQAALAATQAELEATQAALAATQAELEATQAQLAATQAALETTQAELAATQAALDATQSALDGTQAELDATQAELAATQAELEATQAEIDALLPDGTALAVARYQADGSGVEASSATLADTGTLTLTGALAVGDAATSRTNLGLGTAADVQFSRLGLGRAVSTAARLVFAAELAQKILCYGDAVNFRYGLGVVSGALQVFSASNTRIDCGGMSITDGTTFTPVLTVVPTTQRVGVGNVTAPTAPLDVNGDTLRLRTARTPASAAAAGNQGDFAWDSSYLFICTATNTWRRVAHATW